MSDEALEKEMVVYEATIKEIDVKLTNSREERKAAGENCRKSFYGSYSLEPYSDQFVSGTLEKSY